MNISLNLNKFLFFKQKNNIIEFNQDEIDVAIGMIMNPTILKQYMLIIILMITEIKDIQNGVFVSLLAKKKVEKIFIRAKAGNPNAK